MTEIIKFLFQINAFIVEIDFLKQLENNQLAADIPKIRFNFEFFKHFIEHNNRMQITFGILNETLHHEDIINIFDENVRLKSNSNA